jgi:exodeoxyribonuclease-5
MSAYLTDAEMIAMDDSFELYTRTIEALRAKLAASNLSHLEVHEEHEALIHYVLHGISCGKLHKNMRGAAGTGKSVSLVFLVLALLLEGKNVTVAAPTHKACSVLRRKFEELGETVKMRFPTPVTLHSLLKLKPKRVEYGEPEQFVQKGTPYFPGVDIFIIDECSMIGADLMGYINDFIVKPGYCVLYSGDPYQLRPVGEMKLSSSFKTGDSVTLTKVRRHTGPVLDLATKIRTGGTLAGVRSESTADSSVFVYKSTAAMNAEWKKMLKVDAENMIMLCYTNATRRKMNDAARITLRGEDAPRFMEDDILISLSPVEADGEMVYSNNADITIAEPPVLLEAYKPVYAIDKTFRTWEIVTTDGHTLYVLADHDEELKHRKVCRELGKSIAKERDALTGKMDYVGLRNIKRRWASEYFPLKNSFADVDFRHALTIHKSQGSTYENVFLAPDYLHARQDMQQLLYVAVTRSSSNLHVINTNV